MSATCQANLSRAFSEIDDFTPLVLRLPTRLPGMCMPCLLAKLFTAREVTHMPSDAPRKTRCAMSSASNLEPQILFVVPARSLLWGVAVSGSSGAIGNAAEDAAGSGPQGSPSISSIGSSRFRCKSSNRNSEVARRSCSHSILLTSTLIMLLWRCFVLLLCSETPTQGCQRFFSADGTVRVCAVPVHLLGPGTAHIFVVAILASVW